ncbi:MAG TPA: hypothetical protein PLZ45_02675 [Ferruginibacter sp.]|nr:hypothetical protein [Chitinophagaceae bacterium]HRI23548.1 hypothetical protein [Ferruginibacter sp.]
MNRKTKPFFAALIITSAILSACSSNEIGESRDVNQDKIYMDYSVRHTEGDANVDVYCTFRFGGINGTTLVLNGDSQVELDGEKLKVDSSDFSGAYYKASRPLKSFYGKHSISFTNIAGKKFVNEFEYAPFSISSQSQEATKSKDLILSCESAPLTAADHIQVNSSGTDSSFHFTQEGPASTLLVPAKELMRQKGNSISVECSLYREMGLKQSAPEGGVIRIRQELKPVKIKLVP